jgi:hypothetical protein
MKCVEQIKRRISGHRKIRTPTMLCWTIGVGVLLYYYYQPGPYPKYSVQSKQHRDRRLGAKSLRRNRNAERDGRADGAARPRAIPPPRPVTVRTLLLPASPPSRCYPRGRQVNSKFISSGWDKPGRQAGHSIHVRAVYNRRAP